MSGTIQLGSLIEKAHIKCRDFDGGQGLEAFGVSNAEGIVRTAHRKSDDLSEYLVIEPSSFAYNPYRVNVGSIGLTPEGVFGVVSPAYVVFRTKERKLVPEVLLDFLKSSEGLRQINKLARGAVRKALRFEDLCKIEFPTISYERQLEILEHKQCFNQQHGRLLSEIGHQQSLLAKLKQAILQDAIQGRLTTDWRDAHPDVEPANHLLQCIQAEKARLLATKKIRPEKHLPKITKVEIPFEIPNGWEWCRLGALIEEKPRNGVSLKPVEYETSAKTLKLSATTSGKFDGTQIKYLDLKVEPDSYLWLRDGDILIQRANSLEFVGTAAIYRGANSEFIYPDLMMKCRAVYPESTDFLHYVISARITRDYFKSKASGSAGNMPKINQDTVTCTLIPLPPLAEQKAIVGKVEALMTTCRTLEAEIEHSRTHADHLLQAVLRETFSGQLATEDANDKPAPATAKVVPFPVRIGNISATDLHAGILARAYQHHEKTPKHLVHFGHVKAEKIAHLVEAHLGIDLERVPVKAAAGPNDYPHLKKVESRAKKANWFVVRQQKADGAYVFHKEHGFDALLGKTAAALGERAAEVDALINLLLPLNTRQAEIVATLYAAWNNLLLLGRSPSDEDIVYEARENWHASKLEIDREKFFKGLEWVRKQGLIPVGRGRYVDTQ